MKAYSVMYAWKTQDGIETSPVCVAFSDPERAAEKAAKLIKEQNTENKINGFDAPGDAKIAVFDGEKFITEGFCVIGWETVRYDIVDNATGERLESYHPRTYGYTPTAKDQAKKEAEITARKLSKYGCECHVEEVEYKIRIDEE